MMEIRQSGRAVFDNYYSVYKNKGTNADKNVHYEIELAQFLFQTPSSFYYCLPLLGRPLLPEAPEPPYFSLSHELISLAVRINMIIELPHETHSTGPQETLLCFSNEQNSIFILSD